MKGAPSQQGGGSGGYGGGGMPAWLGMAQSYFPQYFGGGGGYQPQGGTASGAMPAGASPSGYPTYTGPPRDQPLGAPPDAGGAGGVMAPPSPTPPIANVPPSGLLGASTPDASGLQYGHGLMSNTQNPNPPMSPGGWYNRGYGVPGMTAPGQPPPGQTAQTGYMPPPQYGRPGGLFGGWM